MNLASNLVRIQERIEKACRKSGRDPKEVQLMAVSKGQTPAAIKAAADLGLTLFGESKVQEARIKASVCSGRLHWHMIGHLQTNKCRDAVAAFEMIQSVDSLKLAEELQKQCQRAGKTMPILLEVNVGGESSKFGYPHGRVLEELNALNDFRKLEIHGLMAIAPYSEDPQRARPHFRRLRELKIEAENILGAGLGHLSMGMSGDFEIAIEEGSTMVRVGALLFGARSIQKNANPKVE